MPKKEIRPSPGEYWEILCPSGERFLFFIYLSQTGIMYKAPLAFKQPQPVIGDMIDGKDGWKRVYTPPVSMNEVFF